MKKVLTVVVIAVIALFLYKGYNTEIGQRRVGEMQKGIKSFSEDLVRVSGEDVYLHIKDEWVNAEDVKIFSWKAMEPIYLDYDGQRVYIGDSGLVNVVKFLYKIGVVAELDENEINH